jgi:Na+-translocating ferredoxin:NAD+ oxidoreductase subunit G
MYSENDPSDTHQAHSNKPLLASLLVSINRNNLRLGLCAILTGCIIALTQIQTKQRIIDNQIAAQTQLLQEVMPSELYDQSLLNQPFALPYPNQLGRTDGQVYFARRQGIVEGIILPLITQQGYNGSISLLVGIRRDGVIQGVRISEHQETPGLGDQIERRKSDWIEGFNGRSLDDLPPTRWQVSKDGGDFDQFTGATITPRAVIQAVKNSLVYHQRYYERLYQAGLQEINP